MSQRIRSWSLAAALAAALAPATRAEEKAPAGEVKPEAAASASDAKAMVQESEWDGVTVEVSPLKRTGNTVTLNFKYTNGGDEETSINKLADMHKKDLENAIYFVDNENKKKYLVVRDAEGKALAADLDWNATKMPPGKSKKAWAKFPAPPADVNAVTVYLPGAPPFEDVPVSE